MKEREALKLTLEALQDYVDEYGPWSDDSGAQYVLRVGKEALAQPEQEPVAWGVIASNTGKMCQVEFDYNEVSEINSKWLVPLYTTPPQRTWVGLTDEQIKRLLKTMHGEPYPNDLYAFARAIEAKLKEKNK